MRLLSISRLAFPLPAAVLFLSGCTTIFTPASFRYVYSIDNDSHNNAVIRSYRIPLDSITAAAASKKTSDTTTSASVSPFASTTPLPNSVFSSIRFDGVSKVYALSLQIPTTFTATGPATVHVYNANGGVLTETRTFQYACQGECIDVAADRDGTVYLNDTSPTGAPNFLVRFPPTASGNASQAATLPLGPDQNLGTMVVDAGKSLYATQPNTQKILEFPVGFSSTQESILLNTNTIAFDLALDASNRLYTLSYLLDANNAIIGYGVEEFDGLSATAPNRSITLTSSVFHGFEPGYLAVDSDGVVYVADFNPSLGVTTRRFLLFDQSTSQTDSTPIMTLTSTVPIATYSSYQGTFGSVAVQ